jgi:autotransporter-associated beta strand protein
MGISRSRLRAPWGAGRCGRAGLACLLALGTAGAADAATFNVTTNADAGPGSLRDAIESANANDGSDTIVFDGALAGETILLEDSLPLIREDVVIDAVDAPALAISGGDAHRVFFVDSGTVTIANLRVENGLATGGNGAGRGGGGLGAGGGLFVDGDATVELRNVSFDANGAAGGGGGGGADGGGGGGLGGDGGTGSGGGGGLAGDGGDGSAGGGGGGGEGSADDGADGGALTGGDGGGELGGAGGAPGTDGGIGLPGGGGGGGGAVLVTGGAGGTGGAFGGGGGGTGGATGGDGGDFGGGGGQAAGGDGGDGGFGGGGGGARSDGTAGSGGFGSGDGGTTTGGEGGSGFGGAVFVREGGVLRIQDGGFGESTGNDVAAGTGGSGADNGSVAGTDLFVHGGIVDLLVSDGGTQTFNGTISGDGGLRKLGSGELHLRGPTDYGGGTTVEGGTLRGDTASIRGDLEVLSRTSVVFEQPGDGTHQGAITGAGSLVKEGAGTLILAGSYGYTGGTTVSAGTLQGDSTTLRGNILNDAVVVFDQGGTGTYAGDMSGTGSLTKLGAGTLILTGTHSHDGGTTVSAGTLQGDTASLQGDILNDAALVFAQASTGTYAGGLSGAGSLRKSGAGTLILEGNNTAAGGTRIDAGLLQLDGTLRSDVLVAAGAELGGTGSVTTGIGVATALVTVEGNLSPGPSRALNPGASIGTLQVRQVVFSPGSSFEVEVDPTDATVGDRLQVATTADLDGGLVVVRPEPGSFDVPRTYTILTAAGGFTGTGQFAGVAEDLAFVDAALFYPANAVELQLQDNGETLESVAATPNQEAVGRAMDPACAVANGDLATVCENLRVLTVDELRFALDDMSGEATSAFASAELANAAQLDRIVTRRLGIVGGRALGSAGSANLRYASRRAGALPQLNSLAAGLPALAGLQMAAAAAAVSLPPERERRFGAWLDGYGLFGGLDGDFNAAGTDWSGGGALLGFDTTLGRHGLLGLAAGYARLHLDVDERLTEGDANLFQGALYGAWVGERVYAGGLLRYAYADHDTERRIAFGGIDRRATGSFGGHAAGGYAELGVVAAAPAAVQIEPLASVDVSWLRHEGFRESGAGSLDLDVSSQTWLSVVTGLGVRLHRTFTMSDTLGLYFVPELRGRWVHQFGDDDRPVDARITGATTGGAFRVQGANAARDGGVIGVGWAVNRADNLSFFFDYDASLNPDGIGHALGGGILYRW